MKTAQCAKRLSTYCEGKVRKRYRSVGVKDQQMEDYSQLGSALREGAVDTHERRDTTLLIHCWLTYSDTGGSRFNREVLMPMKDVFIKFYS